MPSLVIASLKGQAAPQLKRQQMPRRRRRRRQQPRRRAGVLRTASGVSAEERTRLCCEKRKCFSWSQHKVFVQAKENFSWSPQSLSKQENWKLGSRSPRQGRMREKFESRYDLPLVQLAWCAGPASMHAFWLALRTKQAVPGGDRSDSNFSRIRP